MIRCKDCDSIRMIITNTGLIRCAMCGADIKGRFVKMNRCFYCGEYDEECICKIINKENLKNSEGLKDEIQRNR